MKKHLFPILLVTLLCSCSTRKGDPNPIDPNPVDPTPVDPTPIDPEPIDPPSPTPMTYNDTVNEFCLDFTEQYLKDANNGYNNVVSSPISMYFALAMAGFVTGGNTQEEILNVLCTNYNDLENNILSLYSRFFDETTVTSDIDDTQAVLYKELLDNSIWVDNAFTYDTDCTDKIYNFMRAYLHTVDFKNETEDANRAINEYCYEKTNGIIDPHFEFSSETLFTLINTFYLKTAWSKDGNKFYFSQVPQTFTNNDGTTSSIRLMNTPYFDGKPFENDEISAFYVEDDHRGARLTFILPKGDLSISDVMTKKNISEALNHQYVAIDDANNKYYETKVTFPKFNVESNTECAPVLSNMGISDFFNISSADFSTLTEETTFCSSIAHVASLDVDEKGVEGAAVTGMAVPVGRWDPYIHVQTNFVVDRAFGFILETTDHQDNNVVFSGIINTLE